VIASHAALLSGFTTAYNIGDLGVRIFFVISGFLITGLLVQELDRTDKIDLLKFYFRRTLRIFPPYYFFLLVFALLAVAGKIKIAFVQFLPVFTYLSDYIFPGEWNFDHAWSLSVEEQFYLLYPGLFVLFSRKKIEWLLMLTVLICPVLRFVDFNLFSYLNPIWLTKGFQANVDTLAIGCLLALKRKSLHSNGLYQALLNSKLAYLMPVFVFLINTQIDYAGLNMGLWFSVNNILIAFTIDWAVTRCDNVFGKVLNSPPFVFIGMMSYSIYLWQQPFLNPQPQSKYFSFPFSLIGFVAFCSFSYFVVEKYSLRVRKKYETELFGLPAKTLVAANAEA
jgi:peptidoglycan/LPS O-acetylase OafA/YrhL